MTIEGGDQTYRPSWKVRLTIRLEEFDQGVLKARVPGKLVKNLNGMKDDGSTLEVVPDPDRKGRFIFRDKAGAKASTPVPETSSDGLTHEISGIIPKKFDWKQKGIRAGDELQVTIRAEDFPFDPRVLRSIYIEFYLGTLTSVEYAQGVRGHTRGQAFGRSTAGASEPMNMIPDTYVDENGSQRTNLRFQGWVDKDKLSMSSDEAPLIEFECKDHTQLLAEQKAPPRLVIGKKEPLDKAIAIYLSNFKQCRGLSVEYLGEPGDDAPILEKVLAGDSMRPQLGPQPGGSGGDDDMTVWDYITDVCGSVGHVVYVDGQNVVIARPSTILGGKVSTRPGDTYRERKLASGDFAARTFIYGRNLESLEIERDFGNRESKNVELRCWSRKQKKLLVARYPTKDARIATSTPGDNSADNKWNVVRIKDVEDPILLQQMAKDYFEARARTEIGVVAKTRSFASFGGNNLDPDLLDMKTTDPFEIHVDRGGDSTTSRTEAKAQEYEKIVAHLKALGYRESLATAYAKAYTNAGLQRLYRLREMTVSGDVQEGVSFELHGANFVQVRNEPRPPTPEEKAAAAKAKAKPKGTVPKGTPVNKAIALPKGVVLDGGITVIRNGKPVKL